jgi:hypothetical protein
LYQKSAKADPAPTTDAKPTDAAGAKPAAGAAAAKPAAAGAKPAGEAKPHPYRAHAWTEDMLPFAHTADWQKETDKPSGYLDHIPLNRLS